MEFSGEVCGLRSRSRLLNFFKLPTFKGHGQQLLLASYSMATYLDRILEFHRQRARNDSRDLKALLVECEQLAPVKSLSGALTADTGVSVIAEVKRRSPSKGALAEQLSVVELVNLYAKGGASAVSVLTDEEYFGGSLADLKTARAGCELPILRKDFTVSPVDVVDARLAGADAVLLIAAGLTPDEVALFTELAHGIGLEVILEVHSEDELELIHLADVDVVGVNQRDLVTFEIDTDRAVRLAAMIPDDRVRLAESGVTSPEQLGPLREAGFDAVLIGESLVRSSDPAGLLGMYLEAGRI